MHPVLRVRLLATCVIWALLANDAKAALPEGQLKGLVIERFVRFVDWPRGSFAADGRFVFCIHGTGAVADDVARVARTQRFKDRASDVRRLAAGADVGRCHVLFLAGTETARLGAVLAATAGRPILSVSDTPGFAARGVLVNLYEDGEFIRFEINLTAALRSRLRFSAKLLRLARLINVPPELQGALAQPH